jgi:hypothetical protein
MVPIDRKTHREDVDSTSGETRVSRDPDWPSPSELMPGTEGRNSVELARRALSRTLSLVYGVASYVAF